MAKGGRVLALSVDAPELSKALVEQEALPFAVLSDVERSVIRSYGLVHEGGGLGGEMIAVPAQLLVRTDGSIAWEHVARRITDRAEPSDTLAAVRRL